MWLWEEAYHVYLHCHLAQKSKKIGILKNLDLKGSYKETAWPHPFMYKGIIKPRGSQSPEVSVESQNQSSDFTFLFHAVLSTIPCFDLGK